MIARSCPPAIGQAGTPAGMKSSATSSVVDVI